MEKYFNQSAVSPEQIHLNIKKNLIKFSSAEVIFLCKLQLFWETILWKSEKLIRGSQKNRGSIM